MSFTVLIQLTILNVPFRCLRKFKDIDAGIITGDISNDGEDDSLMKALVSKNAVSQHYIQYKSALSCIIIKIKIAGNCR